MPSVYSRLSTYFTPQWLLLLVGSYLAYRLLRRWVAASGARSQLLTLQAVKKAQRQADMTRLDQSLRDTEKEREQKGSAIVHASATSLVQKMNNGQCRSATCVDARVLVEPRRMLTSLCWLSHSRSM
jgi:hypothetical protein